METNIYISWDKQAYILGEEYCPTAIRSKDSEDVIKNIINAVCGQTTGWSSSTFIHSFNTHFLHRSYGPDSVLSPHESDTVSIQLGRQLQCTSGGVSLVEGDQFALEELEWRGKYFPRTGSIWTGSWGIKGSSLVLEESSKRTPRQHCMHSIEKEHSVFRNI